MTTPALCLFFALHAVVYVNFLHIWEKVAPAQTARVCVWWAMWSLLAMQATVCNGLSFYAPNQTVYFLPIFIQSLNMSKHTFILHIL